MLQESPTYFCLLLFFSIECSYGIQLHLMYGVYNVSLKERKQAWPRIGMLGHLPPPPEQWRRIPIDRTLIQKYRRLTNISALFFFLFICNRVSAPSSSKSSTPLVSSRPFRSSRVREHIVYHYIHGARICHCSPMPFCVCKGKKRLMDHYLHYLSDSYLAELGTSSDLDVGQGPHCRPVRPQLGSLRHVRRRPLLGRPQPCAHEEVPPSPVPSGIRHVRDVPRFPCRSLPHPHPWFNRSRDAQPGGPFGRP